jgi:hypothetical protein
MISHPAPGCFCCMPRRGFLGAALGAGKDFPTIKFIIPHGGAPSPITGGATADLPRT